MMKPEEMEYFNSNVIQDTGLLGAACKCKSGLRNTTQCREGAGVTQTIKTLAVSFFMTRP